MGVSMNESRGIEQFSQIRSHKTNDPSSFPSPIVNKSVNITSGGKVLATANQISSTNGMTIGDRIGDDMSKISYRFPSPAFNYPKVPAPSAPPRFIEKTKTVILKNQQQQQMQQMQQQQQQQQSQSQQQYAQLQSQKIFHKQQQMKLEEEMQKNFVAQKAQMQKFILQSHQRAFHDNDKFKIQYDQS